MPLLLSVDEDESADDDAATTPIVITGEIRRRLEELGHEDAEIGNMTPEEAQRRIAASGNTLASPAQLQPNKQVMADHLQRLFGRCAAEYPGGLCEIRCIYPNNSGAAAQLFPTDSSGLAAAVDYAVQMNTADNNLYVGGNPRRPGSARNRAASGNDVEIAFHQFIDVDTPDAAEKFRTDNPLPHAFQLTTGRFPSHRAHAYWELQTATRDLALWTAQQKALACHFGSDAAVVDPARIMRLAGSVSYPDAKKKERGYITEVVGPCVKRVEGSVTSSALASAFPPKEQKSDSHQIATAETRVIKNLADALGIYERKVDPAICIANIRAGDHLHDNTKALVTHMVGAGYPDWYISALGEALLTPVSDGGTLAQLPKFIDWARARFDKPNPVEIPPQFTNLEEQFPGPFPASTLTGTPPERQWVIPEWLPQGEVASLYGDGGAGKSLLALQIATAVATGMSLFGLEVRAMPVIAVLCEDTKGEIHRRQDCINYDQDCMMHPGLRQLFLWPRVGGENFLAMYDNGSPELTPFYQRLLAEIEQMGPEPKLVILDTLADIFGGNEIDRRQVNHFLKSVLGRLVKDCNATMLLLAHPSVAGMNQGGSGYSGSTAWNNAVRQRLCLKTVAESEGRVLTRMKANYAKAGANEKIELFYEDGVFKAHFAGPMGAIEAIELRTQRKHVYTEIRRYTRLNQPLSLSSRADRYLPKIISKKECGSPREIVEAAKWLADHEYIRPFERNRKLGAGLQPVKSFDGEEPTE